VEEERKIFKRYKLESEADPRAPERAGRFRAVPSSCHKTVEEREEGEEDDSEDKVLDDPKNTDCSATDSTSS